MHSSALADRCVQLARLACADVADEEESWREAEAVARSSLSQCISAADKLPPQMPLNLHEHAHGISSPGPSLGLIERSTPSGASVSANAARAASQHQRHQRRP